MDGYTAEKSGAIHHDGSLLGYVEVEGYNLNSVIGSGKNGIVFAASHERLDRSVVIKVYLPRKDRKGRNRDAQDLYDQALDETQKLTDLRHDDLATIYDFGVVWPHDWPYAIMEHRAGSTLKDVWSQIEDQPQLRLTILRRVLAALEHAEHRRCMHGDLHWSNIMVLLFREHLMDLSVLDFGTDVLSGRAFSAKRHADLLRELTYKLVPELKTVCMPTPRVEALHGFQQLPAITAAVDLYCYTASVDGQNWTPRELAWRIVQAIDFDLETLWSALRPLLTSAEQTAVRHGVLEILTHDHSLETIILPPAELDDKLQTELTKRAVPAPRW